MAPYVRDKRNLVGLILVLIGLTLIIDNLTFIPHFIPWWVWSWQFLLISIGVFSILTTDRVGPGVILIGIGSIFLLSDILPEIWPGFFHLFANEGNLFWYLIIIVVGASLILKNRRRISDSGPRKDHSRRPSFNRSEEDSQDETIFTESNDTDYIEEISIFGGGKKIITSDNFRGGRITTIFGGSDIVLSQSKLAPGTNEIEVFAMFGGWTLVVPPNWQVKNEVIAIFGGISDKRMIAPDTIKDNTRQLIIRGFVMFGGGEIKSF